MQTLPIKQFFCERQMAARFLEKPSEGKSVIIAIPGGPGLSSLYLDPFMEKLAVRAGFNVATLDLPNMGDSVISKEIGPLSYRDCLNFVGRTIREISARSKSCVVFGQSYGARIGFDLMGDITAAATILTGFPYKLEISTKLLSALGELPLRAERGENMEKNRADNWRKILPLYTVKPLPDDVFEALASGTKAEGTERMMEEVQPIEEVVSKIKSFDSLCIIEAEEDVVVPDNNWRKLREIAPKTCFFKVKSVGHFPMVERTTAILEIFSEFIERKVHGKA